MYFDTNRVIRDTGAGLPAREQHFLLRIAAAANEVGETIPESDPTPAHDPEIMSGAFMNWKEVKIS